SRGAGVEGERFAAFEGLLAARLARRRLWFARVPGANRKAEVQRLFAGGGQGQVGVRAIADFRRPSRHYRRAFRPAEFGFGLLQTIAPLFVVDDRPGDSPDRHREAGEVEQLGDPPGVQGEPVFPTFLFGLADRGNEDHRIAVRVETELR